MVDVTICVEGPPKEVGVLCRLMRKYALVSNPKRLKSGRRKLVMRMHPDIYRVFRDMVRKAGWKERV